MANISVLFVDDEEMIRMSFAERFEDQFQVDLATNGKEALDKLKGDHRYNVVVTDIRMPGMDGLEMIRHAREIDTDMGFIVVSGHGDTDDVIEALRLGARNFIRKPYSFAELERTIILESNRYRLIAEERSREEGERMTEQFLVSVEALTFELPNQLDWVNPITFRLVAMMEAAGLCDDSSRFNIALGLMELISNAIEHGNLGIANTVKRDLKSQGEQIYMAEVERRGTLPEYAGRKVTVTASINSDSATIRIQDDGDGFDYDSLPDPTDPENLFLPSGRGILLARSFIDDVEFSGKGNVVTLKQSRPSS